LSIFFQAVYFKLLNGMYFIKYLLNALFTKDIMPV